MRWTKDGSGDELLETKMTATTLRYNLWCIVSIFCLFTFSILTTPDPLDVNCIFFCCSQKKKCSGTNERGRSWNGISESEMLQGQERWANSTLFEPLRA